MKIAKISLFMVFFFILVTLIFFKVCYNYVKDKSEPVISGTRHEVIVESGWNTSTIASVLKKSNTIKDERIFKFYVKILGIDNKLKPGIYAFNGKENLIEVIGLLLKGCETTVNVTIPEGSSLNRIAQILHDSEVCSINSFIEATHNPSITGKVFIDWQYIPESQEGLLFPDTYNFRKNTPANEVIEIMMKLTKKQLDTIFTGNLPQNLSQYEGCILASIVETEAALDKERPLIASVFYNRLAKKQKLESCATVLYALGEHKTRILNKDLKIDSPYNTYKYSGLPPTPIANFGISSLKAVFSPTKTDYLFFVSDNNKGHTFSKTLSEHNKNRHLFYQKRNSK